MTEKGTIHTALYVEFNAVCDMIKLAIENMDESEWQTKTNDWSYVTTLYHIIDTIEFYSYDGPDEMGLHGGLGIKETDLSDEKLEQQLVNIKKDFFYDYLAKVKEKILKTINSFTPDQLHEQDDFSKFGFTSRFHKYSYVLRHTMLHTGELNKTLRDMNKTRIKWL